ncbi:MAG: hypothetical protein A4E71_02269 [Smithella sp. PtaU1.Bin162]|nr:MAG: hypothetical protein A4E71_02269 [Smithella sp. PtaU1.Bin162]
MEENLKETPDVRTLSAVAEIPLIKGEEHRARLPIRIKNIPKMDFFLLSALLKPIPAYKKQVIAV